MTLVKDLMTKQVVYFFPNQSVLAAAKAMATKKISCVIIIDNEKNKKPIGIVTERDINQKIVAKNKLPSSVILKEIMTSPVITISQEVDFLKASNYMKEKGVRKMPVVENGKLVGIITQTDLLHASTGFISKIADKVQQVIGKTKQ
ncbi:MAG: CBS domain-containing protein [Candidatus Woesearchaeota archaeon]